ncbi:CaiB/BaiF CoA-transferase family protein [Roseateles sp. SL47]|uniref:CaiB/BaiF CoA transferase family protein n=1 Tax=Roseateles sp. SL47 TaxID=2995138 RepID=UPI0022715145|nr:CaiB/BaiF CoA-transferase family protein [Roseateles sp. SL47]WAC71943.1 CaiB/BaiF CoA-transferase family protein [Roseateles sp. SL47]
MDRNERALPLAGLRVVEFTHMVMGPAMGVILADLGAEVTKVEPVEGDNTRRLVGSGAGYFPMYNRNKRSLAIDLKSEAGRQVVRDLLADADVLIENFRGGAMEALGLGYEALAALNPRLIYCSGKGFLRGPYEHRTALDEVAQMMGGLAYMTGLPGRPMRAGASVIDVTGAMFGVIGVLAALAERERTGRGQALTTSLYETTAFLVGQHMAQYAVTGKPAPPMSERQSAWAVYDVFEAADGERVFAAVVSDTQWRKFCEAFGLDEFLADSSLARNTDRVRQRERTLPVIRARFQQLSQGALMAKLEEAGLPFAPIARPEDLFDDPHLNAEGGLIPVTLAEGRTARLPALPLAMNGHRFGLRHDLPGVGADGPAVLRAHGVSESAIEALIAAGVLHA